jgi:hypothetical protein
LLLVEVIRTVVAVTAPLVAAGPNALTQSPTARFVAVTDWVAVNVVELDVLTVRFWVFGGVGFLPLAFLVLPDFECCEKLPGDTSMPDTDTVDPFTPVTFPEAIAREPSPGKRPENRRSAPAGNDGRVPFVPPVPPPNRKPPAPENGGRPAEELPPLVTRVHDPFEAGVSIVMLRAAIVVLDFLDGVPVTVTQSPAVNELTDCVTVWLNCVVGVQLTVVCPVVGFWTSMLEPLSAATLPVAPMGAFEEVVAAPALEPTAATATSAVAPVPINRAQRRQLLLRLVGVCIGLSLFLVSLLGCSIT